MIKNIKHSENGRWTWEVDGIGYATNNAGNGIFREDEYGCYNYQVVGTCDFHACNTMSGMRRKLKLFFCAIG